MKDSNNKYKITKSQVIKNEECDIEFELEICEPIDDELEKLKETINQGIHFDDKNEYKDIKNREITFYSLVYEEALRSILTTADTMSPKSFIELGFEEKWIHHLWIDANNKCFLEKLTYCSDLTRLNSMLDEQIDLYAQKYNEADVYETYIARANWLKHTIFICKNEYNKTLNEIYQEVVNWCEEYRNTYLEEFNPNNNKTQEYNNNKELSHIDLINNSDLIKFFYDNSTTIIDYTEDKFIEAITKASFDKEEVRNRQYGRFYLMIHNLIKLLGYDWGNMFFDNWNKSYTPKLNSGNIQSHYSSVELSGQAKTIQEYSDKMLKSREK